MREILVRKAICVIFVYFYRKISHNIALQRGQENVFFYLTLLEIFLFSPPFEKNQPRIF